MLPTNQCDLQASVIQGPLWAAQVGLLYSDVGQFAKAGPYFSQALSILEGELGPSHLHLANVCNGAACTHVGSSAD